MQNFMKIIVSAVQTWTKGKIKDVAIEFDTRIDNSQADWNQNDPNADSYVKNRTHYTYVDLIGELHFDTPQSYIANHNIYVKNGKTYLAIYNGVEYTVQCMNDWYLGDPDNLSMPFYLGDNGDECYLKAINGDLLDLEIYEIAVKKIDSKYLDLPTNIATTDDVQEAVNIANNAQTTADSKMNASDPVGTGSLSMNRANNTVVGNYSNAMGNSVEASGYCSTAIGHNSRATRQYVTVLGTNNIIDEDKYGFASEYSNDDYRIINISSGKQYYIGTGYSFDSQTGIFTLLNPTLQTVTEDNCLQDDSFYGCEASSDLATLTYIYYTDNINWISGRQYYFGARKIDSKADTKITRGKYALIVGNGKSYYSNTVAGRKNYSNAHTLDWDGNAWYQGDVYVGSTSGTDRDDGSKKLATEEYVANYADEKILNLATVDGFDAVILKSSTEGSTKKFKITVDDSGTLTAMEVVEEVTDATE